MRIKAGYRLTVVSWENDGDHYNTKVLDGLSREATEFNVELCKLLLTRNWGDESPYFGNMYCPDDEEVAKFAEALRPILVKYIDVWYAKHLPIKLDDDSDVLNLAGDYIYDMTGPGEDDRYTRVVEEFSVQYVPEEIILEDVTNQFK